MTAAATRTRRQIARDTSPLEASLDFECATHIDVCLESSSNRGWLHTVRVYSDGRAEHVGGLSCAATTYSVPCRHLRHAPIIAEAFAAALTYRDALRGAADADPADWRATDRVIREDLRRAMAARERAEALGYVLRKPERWGG